MKRAAILLAIVIFLAWCIALAGCSDLAATGSASKQIDADVTAAAVRVASTQPAAALAANAAMFGGYYQSATVNPFAWFFDGHKQLLVSATLYGDLQGKAVRSEEYARRAATQPATQAATQSAALPAWTQYQLLDIESGWMRTIARERDGK